jgi:hypothetical protein
MTGGHPCRYVSFEPGTDYGASSIKAKHLRCRDAAKVIRRLALADARTPYDFTGQLRARQLGDQQSGQAHSDARCRRGLHVLVFALT